MNTLERLLEVKAHRDTVRKEVVRFCRELETIPEELRALLAADEAATEALTAALKGFKND